MKKQQETPVQRVDRLLGLGDQFVENWSQSNDAESRADGRTAGDEWDRVRPQILRSIAVIEMLATTSDPEDMVILRECQRQARACYAALSVNSQEG